MVILLVFSVCSFSEDRITIFVNESGYAIGNNDAELDSDKLLSHLKRLGVKRIQLVVDVCAGPVSLTKAYVALSKLNVTSIDLKSVGKLEKGSCKNK
jgi:hypothetical protein